LHRQSVQCLAMNVSCCQLDIAWEDKPANHNTVRHLLLKASPRPGSLVLLPEMFSTGFSMNVATVTDTHSRADQKFLAELSAELGVYLIGGFVITGPEGKGRNVA